jgi:hypothetical protein
MRVGFQDLAISGLQLAQLLRLRFVRVDRKAFVDEQVPDLFSTLSRVKRFVLSVAYATKLLVRSGRLSAIAASDELNYAFALINLLPKNFAQISASRAEDILPNWLVTEESQRVGDELPGASKLLANCGNENCGAWGHRSDNSYQVDVDLTSAEPEQHGSSILSSPSIRCSFKVCLVALPKACRISVWKGD